MFSKFNVKYVKDIVQSIESFKAMEPMVLEINLLIIIKLKLPEPKLYNSLLLYFWKLESFSDSSLLTLIN